MAWTTPEAWKDALADTWMLDYVRDYQVPGSLEELWVDEGWYSIFYLYAQAEFSTENIDFLRTVEQFEQTGDLAAAEQIYKEFGSADAPRQVNLNGANRSALDAIFGAGGTGFGPPSLFDAAKGEVWKLLRADTFMRFRDGAERAQTALGQAVDWDAVETREHS